VGVGLVAFVAIVAVVGPALAGSDPFRIGGPRLRPPDPAHLFGTDNLGRDVLSGVVHGARTSLLVAVLSTILATLIAGPVGALAGYYGGWLDDVLMRASEVFQVIPRLILSIVVVALFGASLSGLVVVIGVLSWPDIARVIRGQFLTLRERDYVLAARATGASDMAIIFKEILPNALPPVIVATALLVSNCVLLEAGLAYLGLTDPKAMSWGYMLNNSQLHLREGWWLAVFPGFAIFITSLGAALSADLFNDLLDPRSRSSGRLEAT
jgi:peptide/nickel transport system permease protein